MLSPVRPRCYPFTLSLSLSLSLTLSHTHIQYICMHVCVCICICMYVYIYKCLCMQRGHVYSGTLWYIGVIGVELEANRVRAKQCLPLGLSP
jgi:hypothetical protein